MSTTKNWSAYQLAIFRDVAEGRGHTVVMARAGSGKTSTIVESFDHVPAGRSVLMVAFNASIAKELKARAPRGVEVSTLHSYGLRAITKAVGRQEVDQHRTAAFARKLVGEDRSQYDLRAALVKATSLAKGALAHEPKAIDALIDSFGIEAGDTPADRAVFVGHVLSMLAMSREIDGTIDFDDMIWLPVVEGFRPWQHDVVFVDETQDLNACQVELVLRAVKKNGRVIAVGDKNQAIYKFRGAGEDSIGTLVERLGAKVMPLSVTYRCAKAIVAEAKKYVLDLEHAPDAIEGEVVRGGTYETMRREAAPGDFVLSRTNAPLIGLCLGFLREGRKAAIQGRDVGASLTALVKKSNAQTIPELEAWIAAWKEREVARLSRKDPPADTQGIEDRAATILALAEDAQSVAEVLSRIDALFSDADDASRIVLSTTHKAKGLERDRAWVLADTYRPSQGGEATALWYVAVTRAKRSLRLVTKGTGSSEV